MTSEQPDIWVFSPGRTLPEHLEAMLVQRHDLLATAVARVADSVQGPQKHYQLFVGPRGCGKTHLITMIVNRVMADSQTETRLRLAWFNEDEVSGNYADFLVKLYQSLSRRYPAEFTSDVLDHAWKAGGKKAESILQSEIEARASGHVVLIVIENLDAHLEGIGDPGQKKLRAWLQESGRVAIVASAQKLTGAMADRKNAFYGFFRTEHLKPMSPEQATQLLSNLAQLRKQPEVVAFLQSPRGQARVRALHHLSGGNHRIYIVLSQFIDRESIDALVPPFIKMIDELTPYYQERLRWLAPQQRLIAELLCRAERTMPVKEIAARVFATHQTVSKQLQNLRSLGYVESRTLGRESLYEISEPLMRLCIEVKEQQHEPLRLLINFLRVWYDHAELTSRAERCAPGSLDQRYVLEAIRAYEEKGNLRREWLMDDLRKLVPDTVSDDARKGLDWLESALPEECLAAIHAISEGGFARSNDEIAHELIRASDRDGVRSVSPQLVGSLLTRGTLSAVHSADLKLLSRVQGVLDALARHADSGVLQVILIAQMECARTASDRILAVKKAEEFLALKPRNQILETMALSVSVSDSSGVLDDEVRIERARSALMHTDLHPYMRADIKLTLASLLSSHGAFDESLATYGGILADNDIDLRFKWLAAVGAGGVHKLRGRLDKCLELYGEAIALSQHGTQSRFSLQLAADAHLDCQQYAKADELLTLALSYDSQHHFGFSEHAGRFVARYMLGDATRALEQLDSALAVREQRNPLEESLFGTRLVDATYNASHLYHNSQQRLTDVLLIFSHHGQLDYLADLLVRHMGDTLDPDDDDAPSTLARYAKWVAHWTEIAAGHPELAMPMRLMRAGLDLAQNGWSLPGALSTLTAPEREILRQALFLSESESDLDQR